MRIFLAAAAVALATPALAAPVALPVDVADGATWMITTHRIREDGGDRAPRKVESRARYKATYRASGETDRLVLQLLEGSLGGDATANLPLNELKEPVELEVDEAMTPLRLADWPAVRAAMYRVVDSMAPEPQARQIARSIFDPMNGETAVAVIYPHMTYLGLAQGLALDPASPHRYEAELPNPLGGPSITADAVLALDPAAAASERPVVTWTQTMNPESLAASLKGAMRAMLANATTPEQLAKAEAAAKDLAMSREDRCRFEIDRPSGLAVNTVCSTVVKLSLAGQRVERTDRWTITQTLPEPR